MAEARPQASVQKARSKHAGKSEWQKRDRKGACKKPAVNFPAEANGRNATARERAKSPQ
ncbi:MAG: hypothetical protein KIS76_01300 [Pyrinomonadaceae bacterium]|nr:hypothetical protein [Pyrinomonadaceae bacterium]